MGDINIEAAPRTLLDFAWWGLVAVSSWCWTAFVLFIGMRYLNHTNKWLQYGQEAILPFFVVHQPVIVVIAYFVVQWNTGILPKMLAVVLGGFTVSLGLYQFVIRRISPLRAMFGMKSRRLEAQPLLSVHKRATLSDRSHYLTMEEATWKSR
jgi:surface polysaccharide O-acyltransferase-like enzyme